MRRRPAISGPAAGAILLLLLGRAIPAGGQQAELRGRVLLGPDSVPLGGAEVSLHAVGEDTTGVLLRDTAAADGTFSFRVPPADTGTLFLVTVRHDGAVYFGPPFHRTSRAPEPYRVLAYPTRPVTGATRLPLRRHLVVESVGDALQVVDVAQVANDSAWTWTSSTADEPVWSVALPAGARGVTAAPGGVARGRVTVAGGRAEVRAAVPPGGGRLVLRYRLPAGREITLPVDRPVTSLDLMVPAGADVSAVGLDAREPVTVRGREYRRYAAGGLAPGAAVSFTVAPGGSAATGTGRPLLPWVLLGLGAALLAAAAWIHHRLRPGGGRG